jgi:hypothetical protein
MAALKKLSAFLAGLLGLAAVEPAAPPVESGVLEEGKYLYAWIRQGGFEVRERLPAHIRKLPEAKQSELLDEALAKLKKKIARQNMRAVAEGVEVAAALDAKTFELERDEERRAKAEEKRARRGQKRRAG